MTQSRLQIEDKKVDREFNLNYKEKIEEIDREFNIDYRQKIEKQIEDSIQIEHQLIFHLDQKYQNKCAQ